MNLFRMALRNLGRARSRTALSLISIAVGVMVVIMAKGVIDGFLDQVVTSTIRFASGHIRIVDADYPLKEQLLSLNYTVKDELIDSLAKEEGVAAISPRIRFGGLLSQGEESEAILVTAIDRQADEPLSRLSRYLEGRYMEPGTREAILGRNLLAEHGLAIGDKFTLVFNTAYGSLKGITFQVVGSLESGYVFLDDQIFIDLGLAQQMLELEGEVTEILLLAEEPAELEGLRTRIGDQIGDKPYAIIPWYDYSEFIELLAVARHMYNLIYVGILILASFVVVNTMVMIVNERVREIGMLGALGLSQGEITRLFLYEGGILGIVGSLGGGLLGAILLYLLSITGIDLKGMESIDAQYFLTPRLYPVFNGRILVYMILLGFAISLLAVWWPSRQGASLEPTQALRGQL
ncbi:MAG: ABC transporter permease [Limnochordia bacterium]|jgi:putative ABC transport system permease protein